MQVETRHVLLVEGPDAAFRERLARRLAVEFASPTVASIPASGSGGEDGRDELLLVDFRATCTAGRLASLRAHADRLETLSPKARIHVVALDPEAGPILVRGSPGIGRIPAGEGAFLESVPNLFQASETASASVRAAGGSTGDSPARAADVSLDALVERLEIRAALAGRANAEDDPA